MSMNTAFMWMIFSIGFLVGVFVAIILPEINKNLVKKQNKKKDYPY